MADADLTIVILQNIQTRLSELLEMKPDVREIKTELQVVNERLGNLERRDVIREAQSTVERRNDGARDQRVDAEIKDLQARVTRLETERG